jgi:uncharacterized protein YcgI (DUF1989 family)
MQEAAATMTTYDDSALSKMQQTGVTAQNQIHVSITEPSNYVNLRAEAAASFARHPGIKAP